MSLANRQSQGHPGPWRNAVPLPLFASGKMWSWIIKVALVALNESMRPKREGFILFSSCEMLVKSELLSCNSLFSN